MYLFKRNCIIMWVQLNKSKVILILNYFQLTVANFGRVKLICLKTGIWQVVTISDLLNRSRILNSEKCGKTR